MTTSAPTTDTARYVQRLNGDGRLWNVERVSTAAGSVLAYRTYRAGVRVPRRVYVEWPLTAVSFAEGP